MALATMIGALGMAQVAIIQRQQYQGGSASGGAGAVPQSYLLVKEIIKLM